ncbi:MAG: hypothetical protein ACLFU5_00245 [Thermoplasmata archaeon]
MTAREEEITVERVEMKPEWLDNPSTMRGQKLHFYAFFIPITAVLVIGTLFTGGKLNQVLSLSLITWVSIGLLYTGRKEVKKIEVWRKKEDGNVRKNLPLKKTSGLIERAIKGRLLSQILVEKRIRRALIEKIKDVKSISEKDLKRLLKNPPALRKLIGDETISDFLMNSKSMKGTDFIHKKDGKSFRFQPKQVKKEMLKGEAYKEKIEGVIKKISDWEEN